MKPDFFWNAWEEPFKSIYRILLFIFALSILGYAFTYFSGASFVINWDIEHFVNPVKVLFSSYRQGVFTFPIFVDNWVISQNFVGSDIQINLWPAYILLVWLGIFISIMMALITDLPRFWFVVSVVLLTALFVGLKLEFLVLYNSYSKPGLITALILYFPALYIFHFIKPNVGFLTRLSVYLLATVIFALIISQFSNVELPFFHLANYGIYVPLIITILFVFMTGSEILAAFLRIITSGALAGEKSGLVHFLIVSIVFLANVVLLLLKNGGYMDVNLYMIGSFWLLTLAAVVGIWGYRAKEVTYAGVFAFYPFGAILFLGMAVTAHFTVAYFFITGNDAFASAVQDVILFSQLGYSAMFVVYVIANFFDMLRQNADVGKVVYKPMRMPYFISRFAGVIFILALFFKFNMVTYYQAVAGYYTGVADLYLKVDDYLSAAEYYKLANIYSGTSHRANYAMATLEEKSGDPASELLFLKNATRKNPTEYAYAMLASKYLDGKRYFEAIFTLRDGLEKFPESSQLINDLGFAYSETGNTDSAFYYLNESVNNEETANQSGTNFYALLALNELSVKPDTFQTLWTNASYLAMSNNLVVLANQSGVLLADQLPLQFGDPKKEKIEQLIYNYNLSLNNAALVDSSYLQSLRTFYDSSNTSWFQDNLDLSSALALFRQGETASSFRVLNRLAVVNPEKEYYELAASLAMKLNAVSMAIDNFKNAFQNGHTEIAPELAFAYMEDGALDKANFVWRQIMQSGNSSDSETASKMIRVIEAESLTEIMNADAETRFSFLNYRYAEFEPEALEVLVRGFDNEDLQALGYVKLIQVYLELDRASEALRLLEKIGELNISKKDVLDAINLVQCQYAYSVKDPELMQRLLTNLTDDDLSVRNYLVLFDNLLASDEADVAAQSAGFIKQARSNPFFEQGVIEAVDFFNNDINDPMQAYDILVEAVTLNPYSVELNKMYALQCLQVGLISYALETKEELRTMLPSVIYRKFEQDFDELLQKNEANSEIW